MGNIADYDMVGLLARNYKSGRIREDKERPWGDSHERYPHWANEVCLERASPLPSGTNLRVPRKACPFAQSATQERVGLGCHLMVRCLSTMHGVLGLSLSMCVGGREGSVLTLPPLAPRRKAHPICFCLEFYLSVKQPSLKARFCL